jgi:hypothetical protein
MSKESFLSPNLPTDAGINWLRQNGYEDVVSDGENDVSVIATDNLSGDGEDAMIAALDRENIIKKMTERLSPEQIKFLEDVALSRENFEVSDLSDVEQLRYKSILKRLQVIFKNTSFQKDYFEKKSVSAVLPENPKNASLGKNSFSKSPKNASSGETIFSPEDFDTLAEILLN